MGNQFHNVAMVACLQTFLFAYNIAFWASGLFFVLLGVWGEFELYKYMELYPEFSETAPHVVVGIAFLMIMVSSMAFPAIFKGQPFLIYVYAGFLGCIFMMNLGVIAAVVCYRDMFGKALHDGLTISLTSFAMQKTNFNYAQFTLQCCGVSNYMDWVKLSPERVIPVSCCIDANRCVTANYSHVYQKGCYEAILEYLEKNMDILIGIGVGTAMFPLLGIVVACCLASYMKKSIYDDAMN